MGNVQIIPTPPCPGGKHHIGGKSLPGYLRYAKPWDEDQKDDSGENDPGSHKQYLLFNTEGH